MRKFFLIMLFQLKVLYVSLIHVFDNYFFGDTFDGKPNVLFYYFGTLICDALKVEYNIIQYVSGLILFLN